MASNSGASNGFDGKAASSWTTHPRRPMRSHEPIVFDAVGNLSLREVEGPVASPPGRTLPAPTREEGPVAEAAPASRRRKTPIDGSGATNGATGQSVTATGPGARRAADRPGGRRPEPSLRIIDTRILRGPNYWAREPVVRMVVDLGVLEEFPSNTIPGFVDALVNMLPSLEDHACSLGRRGGFITRLREGTWVGHVAEHIALEFQNLAGTDVRHGKTRGTGEYGRYNVIYEYREEQVGIEAGKMAVGLVNHLVAPNDEQQAFDSWPSSSASSASRNAWPSGHRRRPSSTRRPVATSRTIRLDRFSLVQLGQGVHQQRIRATMTSVTSAIGVDIASDKKPDQPAARFGRPAGAPQRGRRDRGRRRRRGEAPRLPVCRQAARRQSRPRRRTSTSQDEADVRAAFPEALRQSRSRRRRRRELHHRQRLPLPGHRRQARRRRRARPGRRHRRRRAARSASWST